MVVERCSEESCKYPIVNKRYRLCQVHNYERLHGCKPWEKNKANKEDDEIEWTSVTGKVVDPDEGIIEEKDTINPLFVGYRDNTKIPHTLKPDPLEDRISANTYKCSNGLKVTQGQIESRYSAICRLIDIRRPPICQGTGRGDVPLSHSHTISRARCKELNKTELIWDPDNIELEGYEEATSNPTMAHNIWENGSCSQKVKLLNFQRKLDYIKIHDIETYVKYEMDLVSELGIRFEQK